MTLSDLTLPISYADAKALALVFSPQLGWRYQNNLRANLQPNGNGRQYDWLRVGNPCRYLV